MRHLALSQVMAYASQRLGWRRLMITNDAPATKAADVIRRRLRPGRAPIVVSAIAAAVCIWHAGQPALWADELATWGVTQITWAQFVELLRNVDIILAPYYLIMRLWVSVAGDSELALRLPSILAMVATAGLLVLLGRRLFSERTGIIAGLLFALIPATTRFGQEARPYAFTAMFAVLATLMLVRAIDRGSLARFAAYVVAIVLLGLFNVLAALLVLGHASALAYLAIVSRRQGMQPGAPASTDKLLAVDRRFLLRWSAAVAIGLIPVAPLAIVGKQQASQISWTGPVTWQSALAAPAALCGSAVIAGVVGGLAMLAVRRHPGVILMLCCAVVPCLTLFAAAQVTANMWVPRYLLATLPAWAMLAAVTLGSRSLIPVALTMTTAVVLLGLPAQLALREPDGHRQASRSVADIIGANQRPTDGLVFADTHPSIPWAARDIVARYLPASMTPRDILAVAPQRTDGRFVATECADLAACLADTPRLWLVRVDDPKDLLSEMSDRKRALLQANYHVVQTWRQQQLTIVLLERSNAAALR